MSLCPLGRCDGSGRIVTYPEPTRVYSTTCPCTPVCRLGRCDGSGIVAPHPATTGADAGIDDSCACAVATPPCVDCGEEPGSCPDGRCRDCDLDFISSGTACRECMSAIWREEVCGPREAQHVATCSLKMSRDYGPRDDDEQWTIREAKFGAGRPVKVPT